MNTEKLYYFVIARYVPDLLRNEPRNIGVLLFNESADKYQARFTRKFSSKLDGLLKADRDLLAEYLNFFQNLNPQHKQEIVKSIEQSSGKFQFSELGSVVTADFDNEMDYLYTTFVEDTPEKKDVQHRLKTTIKKELINRKYIGANKLEIDRKIQVGNLEYKLDFSFENGKLYTIEAVDLINSDRKVNTYESAFKFENLIRSRGSNKVETISIITKPKDPDDNVRELLKILGETSKVFNYSNGQREEFFKEVDRIVH